MTNRSWHQDLARRLKRCWNDVEIFAVVDNGLQAVAEIGRLNPRFAFLDIRMPGLNGLEVAAAAGNTRVIFVTAYEEYAVAAFEASAADYLVPPRLFLVSGNKGQRLPNRFFAASVTGVYMPTSVPSGSRN